MEFCQWKLISFENFFIEICSLVCGWWKVITGLDNGSETNRQQAIFWTNGDPVQIRKSPDYICGIWPAVFFKPYTMQGHVYVAPGGDELTH